MKESDVSHVKETTLRRKGIQEAPGEPLMSKIAAVNVYGQLHIATTGGVS